MHYVTKEVEKRKLQAPILLREYKQAMEKVYEKIEGMENKKIPYNELSLLYPKLSMSLFHIMDALNKISGDYYKSAYDIKYELERIEKDFLKQIEGK